MGNASASSKGLIKPFASPSPGAPNTSAFPDRFTTMVGLPGSYPGDASDLSALTGKQIRLLIGELDTGWVDGSENTFASMQELGICATLEVMDGQGNVLALGPRDLMDGIDQAHGKEHQAALDPKRRLSGDMAPGCLTCTSVVRNRRPCRRLFRSARATPSRSGVAQTDQTGRQFSTIASSSISKISVAFGPITPCEPWGP
jgi:hypothetical protein